MLAKKKYLHFFVLFCTRPAASTMTAAERKPIPDNVAKAALKQVSYNSYLGYAGGGQVCSD
jgi:hypothetical protein